MIQSRPVQGLDINSARDQLGALSRKAGPALYQRLKLASFILANDPAAQASPAEAAKSLQDEYFPDAAASLWDMVQAFRLFPSEEEWRRVHYNVRVMLDDLAAHRRKEKQKQAPSQPGRRRTAKVADLEQERDKVKGLEAEMRQAQAAQSVQAQAQQQTIARLREENAALRRENERLKEELDGLRAQLELSLAEVA